MRAFMRCGNSQKTDVLFSTTIYVNYSTAVYNLWNVASAIIKGKEKALNVTLLLKKTGIQKKVSNWSHYGLFQLFAVCNAEELVLQQKKGIDTFIVNYSYHFSGGERQRLALARVILRKPVLLLLDEATASLDQENEKKFLTYLSEIKKTSTVVFVTHKTELLKFFDNIINLDT
mgnify:CR=1 FL=1|jgi:ABC-type multidrug transport system fused ATPase/permease subunit